MKDWLLALVLAIGLAGCATVAEPPQSADQLRATHGLVLAALPQGEAQGALVLRSVQDGSQHTLKRQPDFGADLHGLWVPAGDYQIVDLLKSDGTAYAPVRVERGRITSLGAVVKLQLGGYVFVRLALPHPEAAASVQAVAQRLQAHLVSADPLAWSTTSVPMARRIEAPGTGMGLIADLLMEYDRRVNMPPLRQRMKDAKTVDELYRLALTAMPPQTDEPGVDAEGALYYGAELGQVRMRSRDGVWRSLDTGTLQAITAVEANGRQLLAGTADGVIRASDDDGRTWRSVAAVDPAESIVDIDRVGAHWIVLTVRAAPLPQAPHIQAARQWRAYRAPQDQIGNLELLRETAYANPITLLWGVTVRGQALNGNTYYVNSFTEVQKLDVDQKSWTSLKPPQSATTRFGPSADGKMLTAYMSGGAFSKLHVSFDQGASWRQLDTPPYTVFDVHFDGLDKGRATRFSMGAFSSTLEFLSYDPATDRWTKNYEAPAGCVRLLRGADDFQRFCLTNGGSILDRAEGRWVPEFAVE